jgi:8-oxo-dGTP diphosphatase
MTGWPQRARYLRQIRAPVPRSAGMNEDVCMAISVDGPPGRARIVTAFLRDGKRVLLCHRSADRRWYPDVWDLPGGHVEAGESPGIALVRELREELGISIPQPLGPPLREFGADTFDMQIWLVDAWAGTPVNAAPDEHDEIGWFGEPELAALPLAHENYLGMFAEMLTWRDG